jgi:PLD-like domain/KH domain
MGLSQSRNAGAGSSASRHAAAEPAALNVPARFRGAIVGQRAANLKAVEALGVSVRLSDRPPSDGSSSASAGSVQSYGTGSAPPSPDVCVVVIVGEKSAEAQALVESLIFSSLVRDGDEKVELGVPETPAEKAGRFALTSDPLVRLSLKVPSNKHSRILGKGACVLRAIERRFAVAVTVPQRGDKSETVVVDGTKKMAELAVREISARTGLDGKASASELCPEASVNRFFDRVPLPSRETQALDEVLMFPNRGEDLARFFSVLRSPVKSLDVCVFTISDNRVADILVDLHRGGLKVRVISDDDHVADRGSDVQRFSDVGIEVKVDDAKDVLMHHKFAVIDGRVVVNGRSVPSQCEPQVAICLG